MMGPLSVTTPSKKLSLLVFTAIDTATCCIEVPNKESFTVMEAFNNHWLSQYPRPQRICFDNGTEFKSVFREICSNYGLKAKPTTTYNPQSNSIIVRVHQTLRDNLATFELSNRELPEYDPFGSFLSTAALTIRRTIHSTLQATPGQLVFGRDMLLNIPFKADCVAIQK
jgi:transposase InsO family protein